LIKKVLERTAKGLNMPTTYSQDLRFTLIGNGEQSGTWGDTTNVNIGSLIEDAISTTTAVAVSDDKQALTWANGAPDQSRCAGLNLSISPSWLTPTAFELYAPPVEKLYLVKNSSGYTATFYVATAYSGTTAAVGATSVIIPTGKSVLVRSDGVDMVEQLNHIAGDLSIAGNQSVTGNTTITGDLTVVGTTTFDSSANLSGTPTAPTPAAGSNNTQIATTAFVTSAVGNVTNVLNITNWAITETFANQLASISIASPAVVSVPLAPANGTAVSFSTTGALPSGITANTPYYVYNRSGSSYNLTTTAGSVQTATVSTGGTFTGSISGTTLSITGISTGTVSVGQIISGTGITAGTTITAFLTGTGNTGTYTVSVSQTVGSITITAVGTLVTVGAAPSNGDIVIFTTTGTLPTGITAGTPYYVINRTSTTFQFAVSSGSSTPVQITGASQTGTQTSSSYTLVNTSGSQSGTQTETTSKMYFSYKGSNKMSVDLGGNAIMVGNVTAFGTP
jgi:hypothetical protein